MTDIPPEDRDRVLAPYALRFIAGDREALMWALHWCLNHNVPPPNWVLAEFNRGFDKWNEGEVREFGAAFGIERRKGKHLKSATQEYRLIAQVASALVDAEKKGRALDDELFAEIGEQLHIGKTKVKELRNQTPPTWGLRAVARAVARVAKATPSARQPRARTMRKAAAKTPARPRSRKK